MLEAALALAKGGLRVFPCAKKIPLTQHGFQDASTDPAQIERWWAEHPDAQIGVATGPASNLLVLDADSPEAIEWVAAKFLPPTREVETSPRHRQYWFRLPEGRTAKNSAGTFAKDVDVRCEGGYVIAPPSIHHETGTPYRYLNKYSLAIAPIWLLEPAPRNNGDNAQTMPIIHEGEGRHMEALRFAGGLRARGAGEAAIAAALKIFSEQHCRPPLEAAWIQKTASYIVTKPPGFRGQPSEVPTEISIEYFDKIPREKIVWLWPNRVPCGKLCILAGDPGLGKSLVALDIAARMTRGRDFPDGAKCQQGAALILSAEDDARDTVGPRLDAARADASRIARIRAVRVTHLDGTSGESQFSLERDLSRLEESLRGHSDFRLVILDPLTAYLGTKVNSWRDSEVRSILGPVADFAARTRIAVIGIMHLTKSERDALLRISGSVAFAAAARVVWGFGTDPDDPARRLMVPIKNNLAPLGSGLVYQIVSDDKGPYVVWQEEPCMADANQVLGISGKEKAERAQKRIEAEHLLQTRLADGPVPEEQIEAEAKKLGISRSTLTRAKSRLQVRSRKTSVAGGWDWVLPEDGQQRLQ